MIFAALKLTFSDWTHSELYLLAACSGFFHALDYIKKLVSCFLRVIFSCISSKMRSAALRTHNLDRNFIIENQSIIGHINYRSSKTWFRSSVLSLESTAAAGMMMNHCRSLTQLSAFPTKIPLRFV